MRVHPLFVLLVTILASSPVQSKFASRREVETGDSLSFALAQQMRFAPSDLTSAQAQSASVLSAAPVLSFGQAVTYGPGGYEPTSVAVADVNGDGKPDLLVANYCAGVGSCQHDGTVAVLLGNGDGTFEPAVTYFSGAWKGQSVAVADVNEDGKLDLLVVNACSSSKIIGCDKGEVDVLLGNGDGTFQPPLSFSSGGYYAVSAAVADVNRDGKPDILVANQSNTVGVLLSNGDGTFQPAVLYDSAGYGSTSVAVGDLNGDGAPDLLVSSACATPNNCQNGVVGVLLGNGDGTFRPAVPYLSGSLPESVAVADMNGDGKLDLLVSSSSVGIGNSNDGGVGVLLGNGDGTFQPVALYDSGGYAPTSVAVADVNGDGRPDLVVPNVCGSTCGKGSVGVLLGNGDGTFQAAQTYASGGYKAAAIAAADVNGDGKTDLVVVNMCSSDKSCATGSVAVLLNHNVAVGFVSPASAAFGDQTVGTTSAPKRVSLFNNGNYQLTVRQVLITSKFQIQTNHCLNGVKPGTHCDLYVTFSPITPGIYRGNLTFFDSATNNRQGAGLTGTGIPATSTTRTYTRDLSAYGNPSH